METCSAEDEVESLFNKKFDFCNDSDASCHWTLPVFENQDENLFKFENSNLEILKLELNKLKKSLNDFDIIKWHKHTSKTNPAGYINDTLRNNFHPELCTQAWCKFHELLSFGNVIPEHALATNKLNAIHICEAPGAFISSLNHYLRSHFPKVKYKWIANTLNPYYEGNDPECCIGDDRLIFESFDSWCFGSDGTGDIFSRTVLDELEKRASELSIIHLVTADGSINCQECPENQEKDTMRLKYAELFYSLTLLSPGGSLVLKTFTMFEFPSTVLIYILCCTFSCVSVHKPATSKPGNSEVYVIARNYYGNNQCIQLLSLLETRFPFACEKDLDIISFNSLPPDFLSQHGHCVEKFAILQMDTIKQNKELFEKNWSTATYEEYKRKICDTAIELMEMRKIQKNQCLLKSGMLRGKVQSNIKLRPKLIGSFSQRHSRPDEHDKFHITHMKIRDWKEEHSNKVCWESCTDSVTPDSVNLLYGKPISSIKLSLFCDTDFLMELHKEHRSISKLKFNETVVDPEVFNTVYEIASQTHAKIFELELDVSHQSSWAKVFIGAPISSLRQIKRIRLGETDCSVGCSLLLASLIDKSFPSGCFRELDTKNSLVDICICALKSLQSGSAFAVILPSMLTRFTAGLVWILCKCFEKYVIIPDKSHAQLYLICKGKKDSSKLAEFVNIVSQAIKETDCDTALLQIIPPHVILSDKVFTSSLRQCNHYVLQNRFQRRASYTI
ncbi:cap-specific mRNA (nucleoside-2'-O-)-methyltransferase 2-like [Styela clava]